MESSEVRIFIECLRGIIAQLSHLLIYVCYVSFKIFENVKDATGLEIFESTRRGPDKQENHTLEAVKLMEHDLKKTLLGVAHALFGKGK